jgi:hypothetical protein
VDKDIPQMQRTAVVDCHPTTLISSWAGNARLENFTIGTNSKKRNKQILAEDVHLSPTWLEKLQGTFLAMKV